MKTKNLYFLGHARACSALILVAAVLSGCVNTNQVATRGQILANQRRNCTDYGFKPGTDTFATCMQTGINERRRVAMAAVGASSAGFPAPPAASQAYYTPQPSYIAPLPGYQTRPTYTTGIIPVTQLNAQAQGAWNAQQAEFRRAATYNALYGAN